MEIKVLIPFNSTSLDLVNREGDKEPSLVVDQTSEGLQCCLCWRTFVTTRSVQNHFRQAHVDVKRPHFPLTSEFVQPQWLQGSLVYVHKPSQRAICCGSLIVLQRNEVVGHIQACSSCDDWKRPYFIPVDKSISNAPINVGKEHNLPGGIHTVKLIKYRMHEANKLVCSGFNMAAFFPGTASLSSERHVGNSNVKVRILYDKAAGALPTVKTKTPTFIKPPADASFQLLLNVKLAMQYLDMCTLGCQDGLVRRMGGGPRRWKEEKKCIRDGYWFAIHERNQLDQLPYPLHDGTEVEMKLRGLSNKNFGDIASESATVCRLQVAEILRIIINSVIPGMPYKALNKLRYKNGAHGTRGLRFDKHGKLMVWLASSGGTNSNPSQLSGYHYLPWVVAELVVRYLIIVRPLIDKYSDDDSLDDSLLFPNLEQCVNGQDQSFRVARRDQTRLSFAEMGEEARQGRIDFSQAEQLVFDRRFHLVEYYQL